MSIKIEDNARAMSQPIAKIKPRVAHLHGRFLENKRKKRKKEDKTKQKKTSKKKETNLFSCDERSRELDTRRHVHAIRMESENQKVTYSTEFSQTRANRRV